ncbi:hypothetical protein NDU88_000242 [Pleurodeles waltl]|uniref:Uncharacterized protein n=1 Tax=Pleurodeles waltl TaxID=8319 RepID=A0AAV7NAT4_PLEWA|nr:hypothetical protein NDU88_000242 [Pleurodeles waltl]
MGRKFFRSYGLAKGFFRRRRILVCFQSSGEVLVLMEQLIVLRSLGAMDALALMNMWCGQGSVGAPEWVLIMMLTVSSVVSVDQS